MLEARFASIVALSTLLVLVAGCARVTVEKPRPPVYISASERTSVLRQANSLMPREHMAGTATGVMPIAHVELHWSADQTTRTPAWDNRAGDFGLAHRYLLDISRNGHVVEVGALRPWADAEIEVDETGAFEGMPFVSLRDVETGKRRLRQRMGPVPVAYRVLAASEESIWWLGASTGASETAICIWKQPNMTDYESAGMPPVGTILPASVVARQSRSWRGPFIW